MWGLTEVRGQELAVQTVGRLGEWCKLVPGAVCKHCQLCPVGQMKTVQVYSLQCISVQCTPLSTVYKYTVHTTVNSVQVYSPHHGEQCTSIQSTPRWQCTSIQHTLWSTVYKSTAYSLQVYRSMTRTTKLEKLSWLFSATYSTFRLRCQTGFAKTAKGKTVF